MHMRDIQLTGQLLRTIGLLSMLVGVHVLPSLACANDPVHTFSVGDAQGTWKLKSREDAIRQASAIVGARESGKGTRTAEVVTLRDDTMPFLGKTLVGRPLVHVVMDPYIAEFSSPEEPRVSRFVAILDVYLDPIDGGFRKATSRWQENQAPMPPTVSAAVGEKQMKAWGEEVYHAFPATPPRITLADALGRIEDAGFNTRAAKQIVVEYVMWSRMQQSPRPVWAVMLRGVPLINPPAGAPPGAQDQYRHIVDAETGEWLYMCNVPRYHDGADDEK